MLEVNRGRLDIDAIVSHYEQTCIELRDMTAGQVRAAKGNLVETLAERLVGVAWQCLFGSTDELSFGSGKHQVPMRRGYLNRLPAEVRAYIEPRISRYRYGLGCDVQVRVRNEFVLAIECKSYTENAMLKRILMDCSMLKALYPNLKFALIQMESMLGGDYADLRETTFGSPATHTIMSFFDVDLTILTLLEGERRINQPFHEEQWYKPLQPNSVVTAVNELQVLLARAIAE